MIILASASPRRQELLKRIVDDFLVLPAHVDEIVPPEISPLDAVTMLSQIKARAIAASHTTDTVIGADTIVTIAGEILGKPIDQTDALHMLQTLSGQTHQVLTGVTIAQNGLEKTFVTQTDVVFYSLTQVEIEAYIQTGEPMDKAGAYGIQGLGGLFVQEIHGDYFNVVGLPLAALKRQLFE